MRAILLWHCTADHSGFMDWACRWRLKKNAKNVKPSGSPRGDDRPVIKSQSTTLHSLGAQRWSTWRGARLEIHVGVPHPEDQAEVPVYDELNLPAQK